MSVFKVYQRFARSCMPAIEQLSNSGEIAQFYDEERLFDIDQFQEYMDLDHDHRSVSPATIPGYGSGETS